MILEDPVDDDQHVDVLDGHGDTDEHNRIDGTASVDCNKRPLQLIPGYVEGYSCWFDDPRGVLRGPRHGMLRQLLLHSADGTDFDNVGNIGDGQHGDRQQLPQLMVPLVVPLLNWSLNLVPQVQVPQEDFDVVLVISSR